MSEVGTGERRAQQAVQFLVEHRGGAGQERYFAEPALVVVPAVTEEAVEAAVAQLAQRRFADIV